MRSSTFITSLCGLAGLKLVSAQSSDIPAFSLAATEVSVASAAASQSQVANAGKAAKSHVYQANEHASMGQGCKHRKQGEEKKQGVGQRMKHVGSAHGSAIAKKLHAQPTTLATLTRVANLTIAMTVQNQTSSGVPLAAAATESPTILIITQQVIPVAVDSASDADFAPTSAVAASVTPAASVPSGPASVSQVAQAAPTTSIVIANDAAAASSVASVVANSNLASSGDVTSGSTAAGTNSGELTSDQLLAIMPSASSCGSGTPAGECITAVQAAPLLAASFDKYTINNKGAQAAVLALIALESGELKYNQHYNGGSPANTGQGTYNEMSPSFVLEYANALYGSAAPTDALSAMNKINTVPGDSLGSAAWFMKTKCSNVIAQFATSPESAWTAYITDGDCIGTTMTADRTKYWTAAKQALGV